MCCSGGKLFRGNNRQKVAQKPVATQQNSPIDVLKVRLAQGDISVEEYQKLFSMLQGGDQMIWR